MTYSHFNILTSFKNKEHEDLYYKNIYNIIGHNNSLYLINHLLSVQ